MDIYLPSRTLNRGRSGQVENEGLSLKNRITRRNMSRITHLWSRLSSEKWEDTWIERLRFAGEQALVIKKFPASRSIRLDLYTDAATAKKLKQAFGGSYRPFDAAGWQPPASKISDPLKVAGVLRVFRDKKLFQKERNSGKGRALFIPSGMAFGTGDHATTARCLQLLVEASAPFRESGAKWSLLDLGCGSGILALAAELLGATKLLGVDFDERCVRISKENALLNKLPLAKFRKADVLRWKPPGTAGYDIVAANLYSTIQTASAGMIVEAIKPGGVLILSGILAVETPAIQKTFSLLGLKHSKTLQRGKWAAQLFVKNAD
jgi:ribosomal protein L11 methyltransferase